VASSRLLATGCLRRRLWRRWGWLALASWNDPPYERLSSHFELVRVWRVQVNADNLSQALVVHHFRKPFLKIHALLVVFFCKLQSPVCVGFELRLCVVQTVLDVFDQISQVVQQWCLIRLVMIVHVLLHLMRPHVLLLHELQPLEHFVHVFRSSVRLLDGGCHHLLVFRQPVSRSLRSFERDGSLRPTPLHIAGKLSEQVISMF
jgi:hypothetical protein